MRMFVKTSVYCQTCIELFIIISGAFRKYILIFVCVETKQSGVAVYSASRQRNIAKFNNSCQ
jgi:hypothetical protein